jgi:hypothetical protein
MPDRPADGNAASSAVIRSLMPIVLIGFILVLLALLFLLWPAGSQGDDRRGAVQHLARMLMPGEGGFNLARIFVDLGIYVVVVIGIGFLVSAWRSGRRNVLVGLMVVGILGIAYASGMGLYAGPAVSICGFMFILFGGLVAWAASSADRLESDDTGDQLDTLDTVDTTANRTNDHASHSVA